MARLLGKVLFLGGDPLSGSTFKVVSKGCLYSLAGKTSDEKVAPGTVFSLIEAKSTSQTVPGINTHVLKK